MKPSKRRNKAGKRFRQAIEEVVQRHADCRRLVAQPFLDEGVIQGHEPL